MDRRLLPLLLLCAVSWVALASPWPLDYKHIYDPNSRFPVPQEDYYYDEVEEEEDEEETERPFEDVGGAPEEGDEEIYREPEFVRGGEVTPSTRDTSFSSSPRASSTPMDPSPVSSSPDSSSTTSPAPLQPVPPQPASDTTGDHLEAARRLAVLNVMDRLLIALGPNFGKILPKPPTNSTLATVPTPINFIAEHCDPMYKRCSSETSFPSCEIPNNTDPEVWAQRFNIYFNVSTEYEKMDIINATLRLYKNISIPLHYPKTLLIKAYTYTRSLTKKRSRTMLVAETSVSSNYIGWVTLPVEKPVKRWKKGRNNHGLVITVTDADTIPWDASSMFVSMNCSSGNNSLVPLPFEVQTDEEGQRYPALNIRQGSPEDEYPLTISHSPSIPRPSVSNETRIQADDPDVYDEEYDFSMRHFRRRPRPESIATLSQSTEDQTVKPHRSQTGMRREHLPNNYPLDADSDSPQEEPVIAGHTPRTTHRQSSRVSSHETSYPREAHHHEMSHDYLLTNEATNTHHSSAPHHSRSGTHHRNPDHFLPVPVHQAGYAHHTPRSSPEDTRRGRHSEETHMIGEPAGHKSSTSTTESSRPHRQRDSGAKERRHRRKHHHQRHGNSAATL